MKSKSRIKLAVLLLLVISAGWVLLNGLSIGTYRVLPVKEAINYGLDLTGGVYVVLEAQDSEDDPVTDDKINRAIATIRQRIDGLGVSEPVIARQGDKRIRVSIPDIQDQQQALEIIGKTAQLEFLSPEGEVVITGAHVEDSNAIYQTNNLGIEEAVVSLKLNSEGTQAFAQATEEYLGQVIEIRLDGEVISAPVVNSVISDGEAVIQGMRNIEEAGNLAMLIRAGALPVQLDPVEIRSIGPTLGQDSFDKSVMGGMIGIALVLAFMLLYYRAPGFVACVSLGIYILLFLLTAALIGFTLTLPGIAGIILSIGMAVDANVIIFERIREELRLGKSLMPALDAGFRRGFTTIIDSNVTTLIAGVVLFALGSGSVRGFAVTLMIGIGLSLFTTLLITKRILKLFINTSLVNNKKMYGA
ncbi:protein translocase subunit SecD [Alkalibacter saccharofermentans]|uniref:Protein translocase subunit SecD n=1 Tax=Alkalibacter saccharofermentans DSM 14828 TaxID=1120975 RepID=A0A1M4S498_9FIRM|nr:protein translocase subunit SecD [Alkalibacter saccharofermentans]SHE27025.1 preprotein translocase subunit SecD [Alkalibacter saccharofermentans DSM 14828]